MAQSCDTIHGPANRSGFLATLSTMCGNVAFDGQKPAERHLLKGATLFHDGDDVHHIYEIASGTLKMSKFLMDGRCQVTGFLEPGDILGVPTDSPSLFNVEAVTACLLYCYPMSQVNVAMNRSPALAKHLLRRFVSDTERRIDHVLSLGRKRPNERVATFLLGMVKQRVGETGIPCTLRLAMSRIDIADYLGLTQETVCRVLSKFKREGLISAQRSNEITITELDGLRFVAEAGMLN